MSFQIRNLAMNPIMDDQSKIRLVIKYGTSDWNILIKELDLFTLCIYAFNIMKVYKEYNSDCTIKMIFFA